MNINEVNSITRLNSKLKLVFTNEKESVVSEISEYNLICEIDESDEDFKYFRDAKLEDVEEELISLGDDHKSLLQGIILEFEEKNNANSPNIVQFPPLEKKHVFEETTYAFSLFKAALFESIFNTPKNKVTGVTTPPTSENTLTNFRSGSTLFRKPGLRAHAASMVIASCLSLSIAAGGGMYYARHLLSPAVQLNQEDQGMPDLSGAVSPMPKKPVEERISADTTNVSQVLGIIPVSTEVASIEHTHQHYFPNLHDGKEVALWRLADVHSLSGIQKLGDMVRLEAAREKALVMLKDIKAGKYSLEPTNENADIVRFLSEIVQTNQVKTAKSSPCIKGDGFFSYRVKPKDNLSSIIKACDFQFVNGRSIEDAPVINVGDIIHFISKDEAQLQKLTVYGKKEINSFDFGKSSQPEVKVSTTEGQHILQGRIKSNLFTDLLNKSYFVDKKALGKKVAKRIEKDYSRTIDFSNIPKNMKYVVSIKYTHNPATDYYDLLDATFFVDKFTN